MAEQAAIDPQAILVSLSIEDVTGIEPVHGGSDTMIWRVIWRDQPYALRLFRAEQADTAASEAKAMQIATAGGIPVPIIIRQGQWEHRPVMLLSWVNGKTLAAALLAQPLKGWKSGKAFGQMQAAVHKVPVPDEVATENTSWIEWAGDEPELKARLYELPSRQSALIHMDYHPLNVMMDGSRVSGVLDWANAHIGDPRADFARTYTILRVEPYSPTGDSLQMALLRRLLERAWRSGYVQAGGKLDEMALFYAWAGAAMIRDQGAKIGRPGVWLQDHHLDPVRRWRDQWKKRAGI